MQPPLRTPVSYGHRVARTKKLFASLTRRGPHRVLRGDLAFAGLPGVVYTPESGKNLPGVAFGHDWLAGADRYDGHPGAPGVVGHRRGGARHRDRCCAVGAQPGLRPGHRRSTSSPACGWAPATISVHPTKLGVVGHGFGGSAAVFTAAGLADKVKAAAALFPSVSQPPAEEPAAGLRVPGLILAAPATRCRPRSNVTALARAWKSATLRTVAKAERRRPRRGPPAHPGGRPARCRSPHAEDRPRPVDRLPAVHADRRQGLQGVRDPEATLPQDRSLRIRMRRPVSLEDKVVALLKR